uniref:Uncharacterized protein n=1 Tax=Candidatus Kentrum sp. SD TaxID=2126332 RepID=A0A451BKP1_9GAMM|nr:MAG: hypothetical protein BECKSD772D_GA0070982_10281 [Candidatus Kentron sp. SD]
MIAQHSGNFLHRFDLGAHGFCAPIIQKQLAPIGRCIGPKKLELLFQKIAFHCFQVVLQKFRQLAPLLFCKVIRSFEENPAAFYQHRFNTGIEELKKDLDTYIKSFDAAKEQQAAASHAIDVKNEDMEKVVDEAKRILRYAENVTGSDNTKLKYLGWCAFRRT